MAIIFSEDFETGSSPWGFDSNTNWGNGTLVLDTTSKIAGVNCAKITRTGAGGNFLEKDLGSDYSEIYLQYKFFVASDWAWSSASYGIGGGILSSADGEIGVYGCDDMGDGALSITLSGSSFGWHDSGIDFVKGSVNTIEIYYKFNATTGIVRAWLNNGVEGSPDYEATGVNTGSASARKIRTPEVWTDGAHPDLFIDDVIVATSFIGISDERNAKSYGGFANSVNDSFGNTTYKDGSTTATWTGDGDVTIT